MSIMSIMHQDLYVFLLEEKVILENCIYRVATCKYGDKTKIYFFLVINATL